MAIDYLEDLERQISDGVRLYACQGASSNEWYLGRSIDELRQKAQRTANSLKLETNIYRLINYLDTTSADSFLVVRRFLEPTHDGTPRMQWSLVDTREASEMMRDVSQGPSPYFGAVVEETLAPSR